MRGRFSSGHWGRESAHTNHYNGVTPILSRILSVLSPSLTLAVSSVYAGTSSGLIFTDITDQAGIAMPDELTESVAWVDYDNDGDPDIYLTNEGKDRLFRKDGGGNFTDVSVLAGVDKQQWSDAVAFGDFDNDGDLDMYAVNPDEGLDLVCRNNGASFTGMSEVSLSENTPS